MKQKLCGLRSLRCLLLGLLQKMLANPWPKMTLVSSLGCAGQVGVGFSRLDLVGSALRVFYPPGTSGPAWTCSSPGRGKDTKKQAVSCKPSWGLGSELVHSPSVCSLSTSDLHLPGEHCPRPRRAVLPAVIGVSAQQRLPKWPSQPQAASSTSSFLFVFPLFFLFSNST